MGALYRVGLRNVDVLVTLSTYMQKLMAKDGLQTTYVPNATTPLKHKPLTKGELGNTLLYAGRLEKYKGVDYLLNALPEIIKKFPNTHLLIAGEGTERSSLKKLSQSLGLQNSVTFLGHLSRTQLEEAYRKSSVFVISSTWPEAFGKVGIEAMSVGRPVIATDVGGVRDWLIDEEVGYLVPPKDSAAIAEMVIKLFSDKDKLITMSENARKQSLNFDLETHADRMIEIYEALIKKYKHV